MEYVYGWKTSVQLEDQLAIKLHMTAERFSISHSCVTSVYLFMPGELLVYEQYRNYYETSSRQYCPIKPITVITSQHILASFWVPQIHPGLGSL